MSCCLCTGAVTAWSTPTTPGGCSTPTPTGVWPPDLAALTAAIAGRFADLRARGRTRQAPSYLWYREPHGEQRIPVLAPPSPSARLDLAAMRAIAAPLLDIDEVLDPT